MVDPVKRASVILGHAWSERIRKEKTGEIPQGRGLTGRPANLGFNKTTNKPEIKASMPRLFEIYGLDEKDADDLKNTLRVRREQRAKEKVKRQAEAEASWKLQAEPLYRFGLMLSYGQSSATHQALKREIQQLPMEAKRALLKDVLNGKRAPSFFGVSPDTINDGTAWLASTIVTGD